MTNFLQTVHANYPVPVWAVVSHGLFFLLGEWRARRLASKG